MNDVLKLGIIIATLVIVCGFIGYKIYLNYKKVTPGETNLIKMIDFILDNIDYFVNALQETMDNLNEIDIETCKNDVEYRERLIETAISIIETRANEVGIVFNLSHSTLVNLAEIIIGKLIAHIDEVQKQKLVEATDETVLLEDTAGTTDISKDIEDFYQ